MNPQAFLQRYHPDHDLLTGASFEQGPVPVGRGDVVGVVLMGLGGPAHPEEVVPFLYGRLMDPAEVDLPVPRWARQRIARALAYRRGRALARSFEMIGGASPLRRHAFEQAEALGHRLEARYGAPTGTAFKTYVAMRHGDPSMEEARTQMAADGVTRAVLLPLRPHFSSATTGSALAYWRALDAELGVPPWAETLVPEYAAHPRLVRALAERIDEGLQRFPRTVRGRVQILFAAPGAPRRHLVQHDDPYCCHLQATVRAVVAARGEPDRRSHLAFLSPLGSGRALGPSVADVVDDLADAGAPGVLVVPVSFVSDRVEAAFDLDVTARARAAAAGLTDFEVTSGLNCHPLFVEALADCVGTRLRPTALADGAGRAARPAVSLDRSTSTGPPCPVCGRPVRVSAWAAPVPGVEAPPLGQRPAA
jgi:ferrochelatase